MDYRIGKGPRQFACPTCQQSYTNMGVEPVVKNGVSMNWGDRFCLGGKRPRRFRKSDPSLKVPSWCPRRKTPTEVRIYGFKSFRDWFCHNEACKRSKKTIWPSEFRYVLEKELTTPLTARDFWKRLETEPAEALLGCEIECYQVVEFDDGIAPIFFYRSERGFHVLVYFNTDIVKQNKKEND